MFEIGKATRPAALLVVLLTATVAISSASGARVDGSWRKLPSAPVTPDFATARSVWTGNQLLVFGRDTLTAQDSHGQPYAVGSRVVAAAYSPATNTWRGLATALPTDAYCRLSTVWTGTEALVWSCGQLAFDPRTNHWRRLPPAPAGGGLVVWTGREMIGWGGGCCGDASSSGAAYNPATNRWRRLAGSPLAGSQDPIGAWTGRELVMLVGDENPADGKPWPSRLARAAAYDPATDTWRRIAPLPSPRNGASAVWDGHEVLVVGGARHGYAYNPVTNAWRRLAASGSARTGSVAVWTGSRLIVWGGRAGTTGRQLRNGLAYDPKADRWSLLPSAPLPRRLEPSAIWTGRSMIVWGGVPTSTWGKYRVAGAAFTPTASTN
jgi:N-acetylneuraminic acid mutarotase